MAKYLRNITLFSLILSISGIFALLPTNANAAVARWQKGANIVPTSPTEFSSSYFAESLKNLRATGADHVAFVIPYYQSTVTSSTIHTGWNTPTDESLRDAIRTAHALGFRVMLVPHIDTDSGEWRAYISPGSRKVWFAYYGVLLSYYARIAEQEGVEAICIGTELISLTTPENNPENTSEWRTLIERTRRDYSGLLTYSANWGGFEFGEEAEQIEFWDSLDFIGISAYYSLASFDTPMISKENLLQKWDIWNTTKITPLAQKFNKQILFTEIGYRSMRGSHAEPWNYEVKRPVSEREQTLAYEAMFEYWNDKKILAGIFIWDWEPNPSHGGAKDISYTPQNKAAEQVLHRWFTSLPIRNTLTLEKTSDYEIGKPVEIAVTSFNEGETLQNAVIEIEIVNSSNAIVFSYTSSPLILKSQKSASSSTIWTPQEIDTYKISIGVFSSNKKTQGTWNQNVYELPVHQSIAWWRRLWTDTFKPFVVSAIARMTSFANAAI